MSTPSESVASRCRICGADAATQPTGRTVRSYSLACCDHCGTVLVERRPGLAELKELYDRLFEAGEYKQHRIEFELLKAGRRPADFERRRLLRRLERMCAGRTLVEIGGGTGKFGVAAKDRGWMYANYDISEIAVRFCRELGLDAHCFSPDDVVPLAPNSADAVVMWEVIEHVWDLRGYLEAVRGALRRGGAFLLSTPNYYTPALFRRDDWGPLSAPPVHLNFFTRQSLATALRECGFAQVEVFPRRLYRPGPTLADWRRSLRFAFLMDEPETLYAIGRRT